LTKKELYIDGETNFAAEVSSVFHFLCALSFANKLSKEKRVKGIIFIREHFEKNDPMIEQVIEFDNLKIELVRYKDKYKFLNLVNKEKGIKNSKSDIFYLLSVKVPNLDMFLKFKITTDKKICAVLIDEGTGTYYNFSGTFYPLKTFLKKLIINSNFSKIISYFLLKRSGNKILPNEKTVSDLKEVIEKYNKIYPVESAIRFTNPGEKYAIFISGLFVEMGIISLEDYILKLNYLKNILEKRGIKLLIKPYQSEDLEKFNNMNFDILSWEASCEVLFPVVKPVITFGFLSTSMLTGKVLYGIESLDLSVIFGIGSNKEYNKKYSKVYNHFQNYLYRADSPENLESIIDAVLKNK
jgi:hypothetical protein